MKEHYEMNQEEYDNLLEKMQEEIKTNGYQVECDSCQDIGHLEVETDIGFEIQECGECNYIHHASFK
jgi:hypothetical protein